MAQRKFFATSLCMTLLCALPLLAAAQAYPSKPIRMVVGFPAGSTTDITGRIIAEHLRIKLGQPVQIGRAHV